MGLDVKYPILFLLFIPAVLMMILFFRQTKNKRDFQTLLISGLRILIFGLIIFALMVPQLLLKVKEEKIVFLVDRSASVKGLDNQTLEWIEQSVKTKKSHQSFAVISFGEGATTESLFTKNTKTIQSFSGKVDGTETDIEEGIRLAESLFAKDESGRIVLISDGNETAGNGMKAAGFLKSHKIEMDYFPLRRAASEDIAITSLEVPPSLFEGERANLSVRIDSNAEKKADIRISVNNKEIIKRSVIVKEGQNEYLFSHTVGEPGMFVYKAEIVSNKDTFSENNALQAVSNVKGTPKVLVVDDNQGGSLQSAFTTSGLLVESLIPEKLPTSLSGFLQYQSIIFNNVPGTRISENQMNLIETAVKEFGTGFIMTGGDQSFGLGGYFKTPIEKLLPVDMDIKGKKQLPSLGLVIVMDRSGSMSGNKITLAKEAAARSVELLREEDTLGFIAFDDRPWVIVETKPLSNKKKVTEKIRAITPGGGTEIFPSLEKAYEELENLKLQRKHIILLTDGQSASGGDYESLIGNGKSKNITLSTVALGADADRGLLEDLAHQGSGRFYDVTDSSVIPSILSRETVMATRTYIEDKPFFPVIQPIPGWMELFSDGVPRMNAYIATTPKTRALVAVLSEKKDPVLAQWQYGLGTTIAFTSDVTGKWSGDWAKWQEWPQFLAQLATKSLPQYESESYRLSVGKTGENTVVSLQSGKDKFRPVEVSVVTQDGKKVEANTKLTAPGKYEVVFPNQPGMYFLRVMQPQEKEKPNVYQTGFTVPYSKEFLMKGTNLPLLKDMASLSDGNELKQEKDAFRPLEKSSFKKQSISEWLLLTAFMLFCLEIYLRRFGIGPFLKYFSKKKKKAADSVASDTAAAIKKLSIAKTKQTKPSSHTSIVNKSPENQDKRIEKEEKRTSKQMEKHDVTKSDSSGNEDRMKRLLEARKRKKL